MKSSDVEIMKTFLCTMDESLPAASYSEIKINDEDRIYGYIQRLVAANLDNTKAKVGTFVENDYLDGVVSDDPNDLEKFVATVSNTIYDLVKNNAEMHSGSGIGVFCYVEEQPIVGFFKVNFEEHFVCRIEDDGRVNWAIASNIMPKATTHDYEFFLINVLDRTVLMSDSDYYLDGDHRENYIATKVLQLKAQRSEKEKVDTIRDTTIDTIRECYKPEEVAQKVLDYKKEVADHVEQTGKVSVARIEQAVFEDNDRAKAVYREKLEHQQIPREPMQISKKTERTFMKKQKIVTDNGIEILVPVEYLKNANVVEYLQDDEGNITILLKDIHALNA